MIEEVKREIVAAMNGDWEHRYYALTCEKCGDSNDQVMFRIKVSEGESREELFKSNVTQYVSARTREGKYHCRKCLDPILESEVKVWEEEQHRKVEEEDTQYMEEVYVQVKALRREKYTRELTLFEAGTGTLSEEQIKHYREWLENN